MNHTDNHKKNSRFFKTSKNLFFQLVYQLASLILGLIVPALIIRTYGSEVNGLSSTAKNIVTLVTLAKAGISTAMTFLLYKPVEEDNRARIVSVIRWSSRAFKIIGVVMLFGGALASSLFAYFQKSEIGMLYVFVSCFVLCLQTALDVAFTSVENIYFNATQDKFFISFGLLIFSFTSYGLEIVICILKLPFVLLYFCGLIGCLTKIVFLKVVFKEKFKKHELRTGEEPDKEEIKISGVAYASLNEIAHAAVFAVQPIIISLIYGLAQSSVFSVYAMVVNALSLVAQVFYTSFSPSYGSVIAEGDTNKINKVFNIFQFAYSFLILVMFMSAAFLFLPFVGIYTKNVGDADYKNTALMILFLIYGILYSIRIPYNITMNANGFFKASGIQTCVCAIASIGISVAMAFVDYSFVIVGPIFFYASNTAFQHFYLKKTLEYFDNSHFWNHAFVICVGVTAMVFGGLFFMNYYVPKSYYDWAVEAVVVVVIAVVEALVLCVCFDRKWLLASIRFLGNKIRKK